MEGSTQADKTQTQHFFANSFLLSPQLFHKEVSMAIETKRGYFPRWTEKTGGVIAPDERLPWGQSILVGFNPNTAIFFSGVGTLIFFLVTGGNVPSYLGSSFSFIAVVIAATVYSGKGPNPHIDVALGGIIASGVVYAIIAVIVMFVGY